MNQGLFSKTSNIYCKNRFYNMKFNLYAKISI